MRFDHGGTLRRRIPEILGPLWWEASGVFAEVTIESLALRRFLK